MMYNMPLILKQHLLIDKNRRRNKLAGGKEEVWTVVRKIKKKKAER